MGSGASATNTASSKHDRSAKDPIGTENTEIGPEYPCRPRLNFSGEDGYAALPKRIILRIEREAIALLNMKKEVESATFLN